MSYKTCFQCFLEVHSLAKHWQESYECKKKVLKIGKASAVAMDGQKLCLHCGIKKSSQQFQGHSKRCLRDRSKSEKNYTSSSGTKKIKVDIIENPDTDPIISKPINLSPLEESPKQQQLSLMKAIFQSMSPIFQFSLNKWIAKNRGIDQVFLLNTAIKHFQGFTNQLPSTIPEINLSQLFKKGQRLEPKIPWKKIVRQSNDLLSKKLILSRIQQNCQEQKNKILKYINHFLKKYTKLKITTPFKVQVQQRNQRQKLPILPQNILKVIKGLLQTNRIGFINIALDLWIIFQSGLRFPSSTDSLAQGIIKNINREKLVFTTTSTKTEQQFQCAFSSQLHILLKLMNWNGFSLTKRQIGRLSQFLPFTSFSIRRGYFCALIYFQDPSKLHLLTQHANIQNARIYVRGFLVQQLLQIKNRFKIKISGIQDQQYHQPQQLQQIQSIKVPQNWFQKAKKYILKYTKFDNSQKILFKQKTPIVFQEQMNVNQVIEDGLSIENDIYEQQNQSDSQSKLLKKQTVLIENQQIQFTNGKFNPYINFYRQNDEQIVCYYCSKRKVQAQLFCQCMIFNTYQQNQQITRKESQLKLKMPENYNTNDDFIQIRTLIHLRNLYFTNVNYDKRKISIIHPKQLQQIKLNRFQDYVKGIYFPPVKLKNIRHQSYGTSFGLVASEDIDRHTFIAQYAGDIIYEAQQRFIGRKDMIFTFGKQKNTNKNVSIAPQRFSGFAMLINEFRNPNCGSIMAVVDGKVRILIYTTKKIKQGDQLFYQYKRIYTKHKLIQTHYQSKVKRIQQLITIDKNNLLLIQNKDNLCYLIASMQLVFHIKKYFDFPQVFDQKDQIFQRLFSDKKQIAIQQLFQQMKKQSIIKFDQNEQNDASQALIKILDHMQAFGSLNFMTCSLKTRVVCSCKIQLIKSNKLSIIPIQNKTIMQSLNKTQKVEWKCFSCQNTFAQLNEKLQIGKNNSILIFSIENNNFILQKLLQIEDIIYQLVFSICRIGQNSQKGHYYTINFQQNIKIDCDNVQKYDQNENHQFRCLVYQKRQFFRSYPVQLQQITEISTIQFPRLQDFMLSDILRKLQDYFKDQGAIKIKFKQDITFDITKLQKQNIKVLTQAIESKEKGIYKYSNISQKKMLFSKYKLKCQQKRLNEVQFWKSVNNLHKAQYSPDNSIELMDRSLFRTLFNEIVTQQLEGINSPFVFIGSAGSVFGAHSEDFNLSAVNVQLYGQQKYWYVIPSQFYQNAKNEIDKYEKCFNALTHKQYLLNPLMFSKKIKIRKIKQSPHEMVIVFPKCIHWGFNKGFNINFAINVGSQNWLQQLYSFESCQCEVVPRLSKTSLMSNLLSYYSQTSQKKQTEKDLRKKLKTMEKHHNFEKS